jgi:Na+/H+ antiporter
MQGVEERTGGTGLAPRLGQTRGTRRLRPPAPALGLGFGPGPGDGVRGGWLRCDFGACALCGPFGILCRMNPVSLILLLFFLITALSLVAANIAIPYPTAMVIAGLVIGVAVYLIPHTKGLVIPLSPDVLFTLILPPLLYSAAWMTSWGEFRKNLRPIALLAIGCVFFTTVGIAAIAMALIPGFNWPMAFALGAIVSPPDAVAAAAVTEKLRIPKRIVTILNGESLVNDASALVALRFAIAAALGGMVHKSDILLQIPLVALGGIAVGLVASWVFHEIHERINHPLIETALTLLAPYGCYILADEIHTSGVLAVVTCGLVLSRHSPHLFSSRTRLTAIALWQFLEFMLNGLVFILIGLQLPTILRDLTVSTWEAVEYAGIICGAVIVLRMLWVVVGSRMSRWIPAVRRADPNPPWQHTFLIGWIGMRGVVSLAAALALPEVMTNGAPLPARDLVLFLTFAVIVFTLVGQSLTLPAVIRWLKVESSASDPCEESEARRRALTAALGTLAAHPESHAVEALRNLYTHRIDHLADCETAPGTVDAELTLLAETIKIQRKTLVQMRDKEEIPDELLRKLEHELDLEESRLPD